LISCEISKDSKKKTDIILALQAVQSGLVSAEVNLMKKGKELLNKILELRENLEM
jgi:hypothetical protein